MVFISGLDVVVINSALVGHGKQNFTAHTECLEINKYRLIVYYYLKV